MVGAELDYRFSPFMLGGSMYQVTPQQTVVPTVAPAQWEIYALLPAMIIFMVLAMVMKIVSGLLKPEVLKAAAPVAGEIAARKMLPGGE